MERCTIGYPIAFCALYRIGDGFGCPWIGFTSLGMAEDKDGERGVYKSFDFYVCLILHQARQSQHSRSVKPLGNAYASQYTVGFHTFKL